MYSYRGNYCGQKMTIVIDSIAIARSAIAILLLLWTTIAILLWYYIIWNIYACLKEEIKIMVGLFCMYGYQFVLNQQKNIRILSKSTNLAEMHRMETAVHMAAI